MVPLRVPAGPLSCTHWKGCFSASPFGVMIWWPKAPEIPKEAGSPGISEFFKGGGTVDSKHTTQHGGPVEYPHVSGQKEKLAQGSPDLVLISPAEEGPRRVPPGWPVPDADPPPHHPSPHGRTSRAYHRVQRGPSSPPGLPSSLSRPRNANRNECTGEPPPGCSKPAVFHA